jgi:hypothetical protein
VEYRSPCIFANSPPKLYFFQISVPMELDLPCLFLHNSLPISCLPRILPPARRHPSHACPLCRQLSHAPTPLAAPHAPISMPLPPLRRRRPGLPCIPCRWHIPGSCRHIYHPTSVLVHASLASRAPMSAICLCSRMSCDGSRPELLNSAEQRGEARGSRVGCGQFTI